MSSPILSRCALARVLQSLLTAELHAARGGALASHGGPHASRAPWSEDLLLGEGGATSLGCDSLELLRLAAAANEMFHLYEAGLESEVFRARSFGEWLDVIEAAWLAGVGEITFRTSGTSRPNGNPGRCTHSFAYLQTEVRYLAELFAGSRRIVAAALAHHIYGFLFTAMLADRFGVEVLPYHPTVSAAVPLGMREGDLVVSIPELWEFLDRTVRAWPKHVDGVVSTAACAPTLIGSLIESGLHSMTEIYGSTETAGIGTRRWPQERYRWMPQWTPLGAGDPGVDQPDAGDPGGTTLLHTSGVRVQTMDRLHLAGDGSFTVAGRLDGSVQVGGTNVYPARVAALLASRPGVAEAVVGLMPPSEGGRLKAFIVPAAGTLTETVRKELELWMEEHLSAVERPRALLFGSAIPPGWPRTDGAQGH